MNKKPLKVALATQSISHFEVPLYRLCDAEPALEFNVYYLDPVFDGAQYDEQYQQQIGWGEDMLSGYKSVRCKSATEISKKLGEWNAEVVIVNGYTWPGAMKLILTNWIRHLPQIQRGPLNFYKDPGSGFLGHLRRPLRPFILRLFQAYHYSGEHSEKALLKAGVPVSDLFFVPYGVDTKYFLDASAKEEAAAKELRVNLGWGQEDKVILYICHHNWVKGPDIAMEVFARFQRVEPKMRALIVGKGRMTETMLGFAKKHLSPGSYHFAGFVPSKQTVKYYLLSDVVIFTSRYETWARAVNEAMLCRRVCVVNKMIPASGGLVNHFENGFVVNRPRVEGYVEALKKYFGLSDSEKEHMNGCARRSAITMSYENHLDDLRNSIKHAISRRKQ